MNNTKGQQAPVAKFKAGSVSGALWENQVQVKGKTVKMLKVTVQRRFKDKDGVWKNSSSFSRNEIPLAAYCLEQAFKRMLEDEESESDNNSIEEDLAE
jgi:hypothetical protein